MFISRCDISVRHKSFMINIFQNVHVIFPNTYSRKNERFKQNAKYIKNSIQFYAYFSYMLQNEVTLIFIKNLHNSFLNCESSISKSPTLAYW